MARRLVYLDHSVLSDLAKNKCHIPLNDFLALVSADVALFPFSWTHHVEAQLDDRLEHAIYEVGASLSRGIRFVEVSQIIAAQALRAYRGFLGEKTDKPVWMDAYRNDPFGAISPKLEYMMLHARVSSSVGSREEIRTLRLMAIQDPLIADGRAVSFEAAKLLHAEETRESCFLRPLRGGSLPMRQFGGRVVEAAYERMGPLLGHDSAIAFFASADLLRLPFVDIESSLRTLLLRDASRKPLKSDYHDIQTWATYLPYVDLAVADRHMCTQLKSGGLDTRYKCQVLPTTKRGLQALIAELA